MRGRGENGRTRPRHALHVGACLSFVHLSYYMRAPQSYATNNEKSFDHYVGHCLISGTSLVD